MKKNFLIVVGILFLFLGINTTPIVAIDNKEATTHTLYNGDILYVGGFGPGNYSKIQDAIDNSSNGDTVFVYSGTYYENIIIEKRLIVIGENQNYTFICGKNESGFIITLKGKGSGTTITGFTILNDEIKYQSGILISHSRENTIENNTFIIPISMGSWSILFYSESNNNIIKNNKIFGNGIEIEGANNNILIENVISDTQDGIKLERAHYNIIENNTIKNCLTVSISGPSNNNKVLNNSFVNNLQGVGIYGSKGNEIIGNNFEKNRFGVHLFWCGYNYIHKNNFVNNYKNADVVGNCKRPINSWRENYWDDWIGLTNPLLFWIPKFIEGEIMFNMYRSISCFNFDINPAKQPYDIGV
jgi:parallel beta-helix repeat protein